MKSPQTIPVLFLICLYVGNSIGQQNSDDVCVLLKYCPSLWHLSQREVYNRECGREGRYIKVWCTVKCNTPDFEPGVCKPANKCEQFNILFRQYNPNSIESREYLRKFVCSDISTVHAPFVCCPQNKRPIWKPTTSRPAATTEIIKEPIITNESCGLEIDQYKIVGGSEAQIGQHPWVALLQYYDSFGQVTSARCGGTLINRRYVITAAHCINDRYGKLTSVVLGKHNLSSPLDCYGRSCAPKPQIINIKKAIQHPGWLNSDRQFYDDIALLRLARDVQLSDFVKPICLPEPNKKPRPSDRLIVAGWGKADDGKKSDVKRLATLYLQDPSLCLKTIRIPINQKQLCAGGGRQDSCRGDSGGPLMSAKLNFVTGLTTWSLVGIVSLGYDAPCGSIGRPGIYTSVANYIDWINANMY